MPVPTAGELAGRSENNRELLERLISNTATIIRDQKKWFVGSDGPPPPGVTASPSPAAERVSQSPASMTANAQLSISAVDAMRNVAWGSSTLDPAIRSLSPSLSRGRRPPEREIASPPPGYNITNNRTDRHQSPSRISPAPSPIARQLPLSPTSPTSPELAPPSVSRTQSPIRIRPPAPFAITPLPVVVIRPSTRTLRAMDRLTTSVHNNQRAQVMLRWTSFVIFKQKSKVTELEGAKTECSRLQELLRLSKTDVEVAQARLQANDARLDAFGRSETDTATRIQQLREEYEKQITKLRQEAEESRVTLATTQRSLEEITSELERSRQQALADSRAGGADAQLRIQEAIMAKAQLQQELVCAKAAEEQREKENRHLRDEMLSEQSKMHREITAIRAGHVKEIESALMDQQREYELKIHRLSTDLENMRTELCETLTSKRDMEGVRADRLQETLKSLRAELATSCQNEALLREQTDSRLREIDGLRNEVNALRGENSRLNERTMLTMNNSLHDVASLKSQLADKKVLENGSHSLMLKVESELEMKNQRVRWLEQEIGKQQVAYDELARQLLEVRTDKEAMMQGSYDARTAAAQAEVHRLAETEKSLLLTHQLEQLRAESLDARVQLTELRSQLASTLARLEGREDALLVLKEELIRTREQLAAAEQLLMAKSRNIDNQKASEEKQRLIEHLESRLKAMQEALDAKDKELAELRKKLEEMTFAKAKCEAERDLFQKELRDKEEELKRLRAQIAALEEKAAQSDALKDELFRQKERNMELERQIDDLKRKLRDAELALGNHSKELLKLTESLQQQIDQNDKLHKAAKKAFLERLEADENAARNAIATSESEHRRRLQESLFQEMLKNLIKKNKCLRKKTAEMLQKKSLQTRLRRYWKPLCEYGGKLSKLKLLQCQHENEILNKAVAELRQLIRKQQLQIVSLREHGVRFLRRLNENKIRHKFFTKLLVKRIKKLKNSNSKYLLKVTNKNLLARRFITLLAWTLRQKRQVNTNPRRCLTLRAKRTLAKSLYNNTSVLRRWKYFVKWWRWMLRHRNRKRVLELMNRNNAVVGRRVMLAFFVNMLKQLHKALDSEDQTLIAQRSTISRRYRNSRRRAAEALGHSTNLALLLRYLSRWRAGWQDGRLLKMANRLHGIEKLLVGKERPAPVGYQTTPPTSPTDAGDLLRPMQLHETIERLEIQIQEAHNAQKLALVSADLRNSGLATYLLSSELQNAFQLTISDESKKRMQVDIEQQKGFIQLLQDALWGTHMSWVQRSKLTDVLHIELEASNDRLTREDFENNTLRRENAALGSQLEATAMQMSESQAIDGLRQQERNSETQQLQIALMESEARLAEAHRELERLKIAVSSNQFSNSDAALHLGEENQRLKSLIVAELGNMRFEGDMASIIQSEAISRLQLDRSELTMRMEVTSIMLRQEVGSLKNELFRVQYKSIPPTASNNDDRLQGESAKAIQQLLLQLDIERQSSEQHLMSTLEELANSCSNQSAVPQLHASCTALSAELEVGKRHQIERFTQAITTLEGRLSDDEQLVIDQLVMSSGAELDSRHVSERSAAETEWELQIEKTVTEWNSYMMTGQFLMLPATSQKEVQRKSDVDIHQTQSAIDTHRQLLLSKQLRERRSFDDMISEQQRRVSEIQKLRHEVVMRQISEVAVADNEWAATFEGYIREFESLALSRPGMNTTELISQFCAQIKCSHKIHEAERRQLTESHLIDLAEASTLSTSFRSDQPFEKLVFAVNTRPKILAYISDSHRLLTNCKFSIQQVVDLIQGLQLTSQIPQSVLSTLSNKTAKGAPRWHEDGLVSPRPLEKYVNPQFKSHPLLSDSVDSGLPQSDSRKWQQLASLETRSTSLRRKATQERSGTPTRSGTPVERRRKDEEDAKRLSLIIERITFSSALLSEVEMLSNHIITFYLTDNERHHFAFPVLPPVPASDARTATLKYISCGDDEKDTIARAAAILFDRQQDPVEVL